MTLNGDQADAVAYTENIVVTACPGSGKTRVLTQRVAKALGELDSPKRRVVAMTFTNRATDEIKSRLDQLSIDQTPLWAGTIHSFAIEWVLRPYAPYIDRLRPGFTIADEFFTDRLFEELCEAQGITQPQEIDRRRGRDGMRQTASAAARAIAEEYDARLEALRLLDYDDALYFAYRVLADNVEIAETIANIVALFCVDEIQDTQDLQYGILSLVFRAGGGRTKLLCVGDGDQAIYESLGAVAKTPVAIAAEFGLGNIEHRTLSGNYRSTQRIIDFYQLLRPAGRKIRALAAHANEPGRITFRDQTCSKGDLPAVVAEYVRESLEAGVAERDICVVAPHWWHVRGIGRALVRMLPDVNFDAPGLSPLYGQKESVWFKIARLFLTSPSPSLYGMRMRWAWEVLNDLSQMYSLSMPAGLDTARALLRCANSLQSEETDGLAYLRDVFGLLAERLGMTPSAHRVLFLAQDVFFQKAEKRVADFGEGSKIDVAGLRKLFRHPAGVVVDTCHGIKGEEYFTVIAFGLLRGYVPNWNDIINAQGKFADDRESKLLYVLCSRAKQNLHLIAESGRTTKRGKPYETSPLLANIGFAFDAP